MTRKTHDLVVKTGTYESNGETKGRYMNVGALMEGENGPFVILHRTFNPAGVPNDDGRDSVLISCFVPEDQRDRHNGGTSYEERQDSRQQPQRHGDRPGGTYNRR